MKASSRCSLIEASGIDKLVQLNTLLKNIRGLLVRLKINVYLCRELKKKEESMNEKIQINIYKGLPMVLEKVKSVALSAVIGKSNAWLNIKLNHNIIKGKEQEFVLSDLPLINNALQMLGEEISQNMVKFSEDRDEVIRQIKELANYICMPYIYIGIMKQTKPWYDGRMLVSRQGRRMISFKEDDILQINMAAMQIANELRSIEFTL